MQTAWMNGGIVTGDRTAHRVRQVLVTAVDAEAPGWVLYAEVRKGWVMGIDAVPTDWDAPRPISVVDAAGASHQVENARIWRGGSHAQAPEDGIVIPQPTGYEVSPEGLYLAPPHRPGWGTGENEEPVARGLLTAVFPFIWKSPRVLSHHEERFALTLAAAPPDIAIFGSIRAENGRWTASTGRGAAMRQWGACTEDGDARLLAMVHMHAAWLTWHDCVLGNAGGRTDWLGGLARPAEIKVFAAGDVDAGDGDGDACAWPWPTSGETGQVLKQVMHAHGLKKDVVAGWLGVSPATVSNWLRPESNVAFRVMPRTKLELLRRLLAERQVNTENQNAY